MPGIAEFAVIFPSQQVTELLTDALSQVVLDQIQIADGGLSSPEVLHQAPNIDSLIVVEILCVLDEVLPFKLTECIVRPGGYDTVEDAVAHLTTGAKQKWDQYQQEKS